LSESFRQKSDPWPPHIKLFWPFCDLTDTEDDEENILLPLRLVLSQHQSFDIETNEVYSLNDQSRKYVEQLYEHIQQVFPQCSMDTRNMQIAQFSSNKKQNQAQSTLSKTR
jgi:hypothetical protein